jgi:hypothetical protein
VWDQIIYHGRTTYRVNRDHPAIATLLENRQQRSGIEAMLKVIEDSIPVALIAFQSHEEPEQAPYATTEPEVQAMRAMLLQSWHGLLAKGLRNDEILASLAHWEPFNLHPALLQELRENPPAQP